MQQKLLQAQHYPPSAAIKSNLVTSLAEVPTVMSGVTVVAAMRI